MPCRISMIIYRIVNVDKLMNTVFLQERKQATETIVAGGREKVILLK
jgi:hypothetical protein